MKVLKYLQNGQPGGMVPPGSMGPPAGYMGQQGQGQLHSGGHNQNALHGSTQEYFLSIIFIQ